MDELMLGTLWKFADNYNTAVLAGEKRECDTYAEHWIQEFSAFDQWSAYRSWYFRRTGRCSSCPKPIKS